MNKKTKIGIIFGAAVVAVGILALLGIRLRYRIPINDLYKAATKEFKVPDTGSGFQASGVSYDAERDRYYLVGRNKAEKNTPVFLMDGTKHHLLNKVYIRLEDKSIFTGAAGGVATANGFIYVGDPENHRILVLDRSLVSMTSKGHPVPVIGTVSTEFEGDFITPSFLAVDGSRLYVGETADGVNALSEKHGVTAKNGEKHTAVAIAYNLVKKSELGLKTTPVAGFSLPDSVYGMAVNEGKVYLTFSDGSEFSFIRLYHSNEAEKQDVTVGKDTVTLRVLTEAECRSEKKVMPSAEGLLLRDEKLLIANSAAGKYFFGKLTDANWCYRVDEAYFE